MLASSSCKFRRVKIAEIIYLQNNNRLSNTLVFYRSNIFKIALVGPEVIRYRLTNYASY